MTSFFNFKIQTSNFKTNPTSKIQKPGYSPPSLPDLIRMALRILIISSDSRISCANSKSVKYSLATIRSQYRASLASFLAMATLLIKSLLVSAPSASSKLAPTDVAEFANCLCKPSHSGILGNTRQIFRILLENKKSLSLKLKILGHGIWDLFWILKFEV